MQQVPFLDVMALATEKLAGKGVFLTAGTDAPNSMTIGWGGISFFWYKPYFVVPVRYSRFTYGKIKQAGEFTVSVPLDDTCNKALAFFGSKSGRDQDKYAACGLTLTPGHTIKTPVITQCGLHFECVTRYAQTLEPLGYTTDIPEKYYPNGDFHTLFYGEIVDCYKS